jgi:hypothetical protein
LTVLSFRHGVTKPLTSVLILPSLSGSSPALLNTQDCCVINVVLVVPPDEADESFFLQPKKTIAIIVRMKSLFLMDLIWNKTIVYACKIL